MTASLSSIQAVLIPLGLYACASLTAVIGAGNNPELIDNERTNSILKICLGGSLRTISNSLLETADLYFHKGKGHQTKKAFEDDLFQRIRRSIQPQNHIHTEGVDAQELLPWMKFAMWADPQNVDTYQNTSYILKRFMKRGDLAVDVLQEGLSEVPDDFRLHLFLARLYVEQNELQAAEQRCKQALSLWPSSFDPDDKDAILYKREILLYLQLFHEVHGRQQEAIAALEEIINLYPELAAKTTLPDRLKRLKAGEIHPDEALATLTHHNSASDREFEARIHQSAHDDHTDHEESDRHSESQHDEHDCKDPHHHHDH
jgi:tetratricopeptide (TPR) repeat protein